MFMRVLFLTLIAAFTAARTLTPGDPELDAYLVQANLTARRFDRAESAAREALARKLSDSASQKMLLEGVAKTFALPHAPRRIEVYDNSHIQGTNAVGAMIVAGPEGFIKNQYRKFNIKSA